MVSHNSKSILSQISLYEERAKNVDLTWCSQVISILEKLQIEWDKYTLEQGKIERALKTASVAQDHLMGRRKKALDNQFKAVHQLETQLDQNPEKAIDIEALQEEIEEDIRRFSELGNNFGRTR